MSIAQRVNKINPSFTLQMATKAADMRSRGVDVINFSVGEPDFNTPKHIRDAAKEALDQGYTKYTAGPGMIELRQAICEKLERENKISYNPSSILVSNGEKQTIDLLEGSMLVIEYPYRKVTLEIFPQKSIDIGAGKGEKIATKVYGGEVGIIFDCRNRPISVSDDPQTRVQELKRWSDALNEYPKEAE